MQNSFYPGTREEWREWLKKNHDSKPGIWLIYYKKHTGKPSVPYHEAVEEALCFGWIDSTVKKIDEERYMQKFTPRNLKSTWSALNVKRMERLIRDKKVNRKGLEPYLYAKQHGMLPDADEKPDKSIPEIPPDLLGLLKKNPEAYGYFTKLPPSHKRNYLRWLLDAKKPETRQRRMDEILSLLEKGKPLGMK